MTEIEDPRVIEIAAYTEEKALQVAKHLAARLGPEALYALAREVDRMLLVAAALSQEEPGI